jgi:hypothetical protein
MVGRYEGRYEECTVRLLDEKPGQPQICSPGASLRFVHTDVYLSGSMGSKFRMRLRQKLGRMRLTGCDDCRRERCLSRFSAAIRSLKLATGSLPAREASQENSQPHRNSPTWQSSSTSVREQPCCRCKRCSHSGPNSAENMYRSRWCCDKRYSPLRPSWNSKKGSRCIGL